MKGASATRGTSNSSGSGGARGSAGASAGGIEIAIDLGIIKLGISTDYGGGIVIGAFGQKIVWGREGGQIHYSVGPMEVFLEARDCTIVRTDKIAGQTIRQFTYPDPGCKLPPQEEKQEEKETLPKQPELKPGDLNPLIPTGMASTDYCMVLVDQIMIQSGQHRDPATGKLIRTYDHGASAKLTIKDRPNQINSLTELVPLVTGTVKSFMNENVSSAYWGGSFVVNCTNVPVGKMNYEASLKPNYYQFGYYPGGVMGYPMTPDKTISSSGYSNLTCVTNDGSAFGGANFFIGHPWGLGIFGIFFLGPENAIKKYITDVNTYQASQAKEEFNRSGNTFFQQYIVSDIIKPGVQRKPVQKPSPGNRPPMPDSCCKALKADIEDLKEVFAVKEMLKGKCTFPWRLRMPGGQGEEIIKDYPSFLRALAQEIDHLGIHPPKLYIEDNNNAVEGNQTVDFQYPSATSAFEAMMRQVWDDNADGDTRTNFLYRLAWLGIQNSEMTLKLSAKLHALCEGLGIETEADTAKFSVPFNNAAGVKEKSNRGQGFGKDKGGAIDKSIDANTELAVERLLPDFLKCRDNQVLIERYSGNQDIKDMLSLILLHLEKLNSK